VRPYQISAGFLVGLVEIDDRDGDIPSDLGYLDLGAQRTFEIPDQLIADGLTPGQYPSLERGIAAFNFAKNVIDQVLLLQQPRMRRAARRVLRRRLQLRLVTGLRSVGVPIESIRRLLSAKVLVPAALLTTSSR